MQVMHLLTAMATGVDDGAKAALGVGHGPLLKRQLARFHHDFSHEGFVGRRQLRHGRNVRFGNDQKMNRRPRIDVMKGQEIVIFIHFSRRDGARNDLAKDAVLIVLVGVGWRLGECCGGSAHGEEQSIEIKKTVQSFAQGTQARTLSFRAHRLLLLS